MKRDRSEKSGVTQSLKFSHLWKDVTTFQLTKNQRCTESEFNDFLLQVGNNTVPDSIFDKTRSFIKHIPIPQHLQNIVSLSSSLEEFITEMFPTLDNDTFHDTEELTSILTPKNKDMREINKLCLERFGGRKLQTSFSIDSARTCGARDPVNIPEENLNTLHPSGFPPHELQLKQFCPLLILKNLNLAAGLCNGTRCILLDKTENVLIVRLLHNDTIAMIPRIYNVDYDTYGYEMVRLQFPVRLAYAMSINKAQVNIFFKFLFFIKYKKKKKV